MNHNAEEWTHRPKVLQNIRAPNDPQFAVFDPVGPKFAPFKFVLCMELTLEKWEQSPPSPLPHLSAFWSIYYTQAQDMPSSHHFCLNYLENEATPFFWIWPSSVLYSIVRHNTHITYLCVLFVCLFVCFYKNKFTAWFPFVMKHFCPRGTLQTYTNVESTAVYKLGEAMCITLKIQILHSKYDFSLSRLLKG